MAKATSLLARLPATAPDILEAFQIDGESLVPYMVPELNLRAISNGNRTACWFNLQVSQFVDCTVLRLVLWHAMLNPDKPLKPGGTEKVLNTKLELLRLSFQLSAEQGHSDSKWLIVCAFLWTSWQRFLLLHLWLSLNRKYDTFDYQAHRLDELRVLRTIPAIISLRRKQQLEELHTTPYLCGWAYRMLQNDRACLGMDLRRFHEIYSSCFGERKATCNSGLIQCDGSSSYVCGRFKGTVVANQSAHSSSCDGTCEKLFWDRSSFTSVSGPKAVDIDSTGGKTIKYCEATERTLAVSHVWSHGQGGRPDKFGVEGTGFNACLHRRYADLAISFGYDSYWMDTSCIPSEPKLRWDCIANITKIFTKSGKTVVCDRDLMIIDISNITTEICEQILAILLVCDWNMRAWTLLEAMRGRRELYLLCQNDKIISMLEVFETLRESGRIDLLALFITRAYLFAPDKSLVGQHLFDNLPPIDTEEDREHAQGLINIGEAAALLSHRHPTRDGDDLLIWSLLVGDIEDEHPVEMWKRHVGRSINTGSLLSSAPRLECPGFGWAPSCATDRQQSDAVTAGRKTYLAYDGEGTMRATITEDGLCTYWATHKFSVQNEQRLGSGLHQDSDIQQRIADIADQYIRGYARGILLNVLPCRGPKNTTVQYRDCDGQLLVVCGSHDGIRWEWKDVYDWDTKVPLPYFLYEKVLLV